MTRPLRPGLILAAIIIVLDQITKWWMVERVMRPEGVMDTPFYSPVRIEVLPFFDLVMAWNRGVSFGIFNNGGQWNAVILSVLSVAIAIGLVLWMRKSTSALVTLALGGIMRDTMRPGDLVLFYHSNCATPGVVGLAEVASAPYPDPTQFDPASEYFDPKSDPKSPRWVLVDIRWKADLPWPVALSTLKGDPALDGLLAVRPGNRLSITPVTPEHTARILELAGLATPGHS